MKRYSLKITINNSSTLMGLSAMFADYGGRLVDVDLAERTATGYFDCRFDAVRLVEQVFPHLSRRDGNSAADDDVIDSMILEVIA